MKRLLIALYALLMMMSSAAEMSAAENGERAEVLIETTMGNIRVQLYNETPVHRDNFLKLIRDYHFYDSLLFHRVIPDFMIQAGDPYSKNAKKGELLGGHSLGYKLPAEIRLPQIFHKRGALAAAREGDDVNPKRESSSTQFYIVSATTMDERRLQRGRDNLKQLFGDSIQMTREMEETYKAIGGTPHLDGAYTVFGEVVDGMDVVDRIQAAERDDNDRPLADVRIIRAVITKDLPGMAKPRNKTAKRTAAGRKAGRRR